MGGGGDAPGEDGGDGIRVAVRVRPFLPHESGTASCVEVRSHSNQISIGRSLADPDYLGGDGDKKTFTFDHALPGNSPQSAVYESCVSSLITACLGGYNATTLAYGQTGAGKTYTILGPGSASAAGADESVRKEVGIIPRALNELFERLDGRREAESDNFEFDVQLQFLELYGEEVRDLLSAPGQGASKLGKGTGKGKAKAKVPKLIIRDTGDDAEVLGATSTAVQSAEEALLCLTRGMLRRVVGATAMNAESSRSHAMMTVLIEQRIKDEVGGTEVRKSKYNFVDLAGSERSKRTGAKGKRLKEGIDINKGLLVLGNVISALSSPDPKKRKFVPFRDSKLTRLLRGSLGGNHKTLLIACVSPSARNLEESINCLRYANRAKNIKNKSAKASTGTVGGDPVLAKLLSDLRGQVGSLAAELVRIRRGGDPAGAAAMEAFGTAELEKLAEGHEVSAAEAKEGGDGKAEATKEGAAAPAAAEGAKKEEEQGEDEGAAAPQRSEEDASATATAAAAAAGEELEKARQDLVARTEALSAAEAERDDLRERLEKMEKEAKEESAAKEGGGLQEEEEKKDEGAAVAEPGAEAEAEEEGGETLSAEKKPQDAAAPAVSPAPADALPPPPASVAGGEDALVVIVERIIAYQHEAEAMDKKAGRRSRTRRGTYSYDETISVSEYESEYDDEITEADETWAGSDAGTFDAEAEEEEERQAREELRRRRMSVKPDDPADEFASALYRTGLFLVEHEDYDSSLPCFEVALDIRRNRFGWEDPSVGDVLYMEGLVRACTRDHDRALLLLYDALRIRRMHADSPNAAATLRTIGDLHVSKGEYDLADAFYEESLQEASLCQDDSIPDVLLSLAKVKKRLGMRREALDCFEEVLRVWHDRFGPDDPRSVTVTASLSYEIGILSFQLGEYTHGEQRLRNFIWVRKQQGAGPDAPDPRVARACYAMGNYAAIELHDADKARNYWTEALQIYQSGLPDDHPHITSLKDVIKRATELASPKGRHGGFFSRFHKDKGNGETSAPIVVSDVQFQCMQTR